MIGMKMCFRFYLVGLLFTCWIVRTTEHRIRHQKYEEENDPFLTEEIGPESVNGDIIDLDDTNFDTTSTDKKLRKSAEDTREPGVVPRNDRNRIFGDDSDDVILGDTDFLSPIPLMSDPDMAAITNVTLPFNTSDDEEIASGSGSGDIVIEIEDGDELENTTSGSVNEVYEPVSNTTQDTTDEGTDTEEIKPSHFYEVYKIISNTTQDTTDEDTDTEGTQLGGKPLHFYEYDSEDVEYIENKTDTTTEVHEQSDLPQYCQEVFNVTWTPWSAWLRAGDVDIRYRSCPIKHGHKGHVQSCKGDYFEIRKCGQQEGRPCRTPEGAITEEFQTQCSGVHMDDISTTDELRSPEGPKDECEFTLYDLKYNMAIGNPLTSGELQTADAHMWCFSDDKFLPFYTPTERCQNILKAFCKVNKRCKYDTNERKHQKAKGDLHSRCWTDFVLGGLLPVGFPLRNGQQMICQKYDKWSELEKMFGHTTSQFATMYDTKQRIPVYSIVTVRSLGDDKWPSIPFMVERGLIKPEENTVSWFFSEKKKGIARIKDLNIGCPMESCKLGERQAIPSDYELSGYRTAPLLTPDIIGWDLSRRVAALTMTNMAPMEPTVYPGWKRVMKVIRRFAINECHIPVNSDNYGKGKPHNGYELPELYLVSGAAPSLTNKPEVIGNDVTVPEMFWISACCAHGAAVSSFGMYVYNTFEQRPAAVSVENLQMLLQANYYDNVDVININLYPAFDGVCSAPENDVSFKIDLK